MGENKRIGFITLCGLIIGPVLGSGIVLLPPIAHQLIDGWAILAWLVIMALGTVFAYVFIFLSLKSPGNEGVSIAVGSVLGPLWREVSANFLTTAVFFGPGAVLLTAAGFLKSFPLLASFRLEWIAFFIALFCAGVLIAGVKTLGRFTLVLTGFTALLLLCGSVYTLLFASQIALPTTPFSLSSFGYTLLLLFWAIVGWEVVGNYIEDIDNPQGTLIKAMTVSLVVIVGLYMVVALALQSIQVGAADVTAVMVPLFGSLAVPVMGVIAAGLCIATYLMIVGAVSRMNATRAADRRMPAYLARFNAHGSPVNAILTLLGIHSLMLMLVAAGVFGVDSLVATANVFFLSNALIGLLAGFGLLKQWQLRVFIALLVSAFALLLLKASLWSLVLLAAITIMTWTRQSKERVSQTGGRVQDRMDEEPGKSLQSI